MLHRDSIFRVGKVFVMIKKKKPQRSFEIKRKNQREKQAERGTKRNEIKDGGGGEEKQKWVRRTRKGEKGKKERREKREQN